MVKKNGLARNLLIWSYERGTLQYDIICALILAFVFFVPRSCFAPKIKPIASSTTLGQATDGNLERSNQEGGDRTN